MTMHRNARPTATQSMACLLLALLTTVTSFTTRAVAAPPALPTDVFTRELLGVLWVDALQLDAAKIEASVKASFGAHAGVVNTWLGQYQRVHASFVRAGGTSMAILYFDGTLGRDGANPIFLFSKSANANEATIKGVLRGVSNDVAFDAIDDWIVAYHKEQALPFFDRDSKLRVQSFQTALRPIRTNPIAIAFVANRSSKIANARDERELDETHRAKVEQHKADLIRATDGAARTSLEQRIASEESSHKATMALNKLEKMLLDASSLSIALTLGDKPIVSAELNLPDRAAAADFMKQVATAKVAFNLVTQQKTLRNVPVRMVNRLLAQQAVLANANIQPLGPSAQAQAVGDRLSKMIDGIVNGVNRALDEARVVRSMNYMKVIAIGLTSYARDNGGEFPAKLEKLNEFSYLQNLDVLLKNPRGDGFGYVYLRPPASYNDLLKNNKLNSTPLLMETKSGRIDPTGLVIYVSGKVFRPGG